MSSDVTDVIWRKEKKKKIRMKIADIIHIEEIVF